MNETGTFGSNHNIDPIAIPLSRVMGVTTEDGCPTHYFRGRSIGKGQHEYRIIISLESGSKITLKLFWYNPFWNNFVFDNWTVAVNTKLLNRANWSGTNISNVIPAIRTSTAKKR